MTGNYDIPTAVTMPASTTFTAISAGTAYTCALSSTGLAYCWGININSQLGDGTWSNRDVPTAVVMGAMAFTNISAGSNHTCALTATGLAYCWGEGGKYALGNGTYDDMLYPRPVTMPEGISFSQIDSGFWYTCAITSTGIAYCWGNDFYMVLGDGQEFAEQRVPTIVLMPTGISFSKINASSGNHTCALATNGSGYCWGQNDNNGQLGMCDANNRPYPDIVGNSCTTSATSTPTRTVTSGGNPGAFTISTPPNNATDQPTTMTLSWGASSSATSYGYCLDTNNESCAEWVDVGNKTSATVSDLQPETTYYWKVRATNGAGTTVANNNSFLKFTTGKYRPTSTITPTSTMTPTPHPFAIKDVAVGASFTLAVLNNGTLVTWGINKQFESSLPRWMNGKLVSQVATGSNWSLALGTDGRVYGWGKNDFTQLNLPASVLSNVADISAGLGHALALKTNGGVVAWGRNDFKQLNIPSRARKGVTAIAAGHSHSLAVKGGKVIAWGRNTFSQANVPGSLSNVVKVAAGFDHSLALKSDGTVFCWGSNKEQQCNVPKSLKGVIAISAGIGYSMALTRDGVVYAWGRNTNSQAKIPNGIGKAGAISAGYVHSVIGLRDGSVVAFGDPLHGALVSRTPTVTP
jgi:alpha-tubulin suppressor-like RCC1 family protein